jgi:hypothetical protein
VHLCKHLLEQVLKGLVLNALVELADEVAACLEGVAGEGEGGSAKVLVLLVFCFCF